MKKLRRKLTQRFFTVAMVSVLATALCISIANWFNYSSQVDESLKSYGHIIVESYQVDNGIDFIRTLEPENYRITIIDKDGSIIFESNETARKNSNDNHLKRPEVKDAIAKGEGFCSRISDTAGALTHYYAIAADDGTIVRVSREVDNIIYTFLNFIPGIGAIVICVLLFSTFTAAKSTKRIVTPIEKMTDDIKNVAYEELIPFATTIEKQRKEIKEQMAKAHIEKGRIDALIANMNEGFLLLDMNKTILAENDSCAKLMCSINTNLIGKSITELSANSDFLKCIDNATEGKSGSVKFEHNQRNVQVLANPIYSDDRQNGILCLIMDITEKERTEKIRREFAANVSHELKTPLTSISGFAEMIENGMVQSDDIQRFAGKIHKEAGRMINLISDIIELSHLDEPQKNLEKQPVDLTEITEECFDTLSNSAEKRNVTLNIAGDSVVYYGNRSMLYEVIYNLCDNAIRYSNPDGGKVDVIIKNEYKKVKIQVKDTGIGIPLNHQNRIFERFYRVDKSHSKETGGTGLGLAIVKHIVEQHNGTIGIESIPGKGTTIKITLPK